MAMYIFRPNLYTININQIAGLLQALQIGFPSEIIEQLPEGISQHFVEMEEEKPDLTVVQDNDQEELPLETKENPTTETVVELTPKVTKEDITKLIDEAEKGT